MTHGAGRSSEEAMTCKALSEGPLGKLRNSCSDERWIWQQKEEYLGECLGAVVIKKKNVAVTTCDLLVRHSAQ